MKKKLKIERIVLTLILIKLSVAVLILQTRSENIATISFGTSVYAQEKETTNPAPKMAKKKEGPGVFPGQIDIDLIKSLDQKEQNIKKREEALQKQEEQLKLLEVEIEQRLKDIKKVQVRIEELATLRADLVEKSIKHLAKAFSSMRPEEAGALIEQLDKDITIQILSKMKSRNAGKILARVKPSIAAKLSEQIAKRK